MGNWDDFRFFSELRRSKTLRSAATRLGTDQATVGRRVSALERELDVKLFEKRSDGYFPTSAGDQIAEEIDRIEQGFESVRRRIAGDDKRLEGTIRVASPGALANHWLIPGLRAFLSKHPKITLQFLTGPEVVNLAKREADIALRLVRPVQRGLHVRRIGTLTLALYGEKEFLKNNGRPRELDDLADVPFVGLHSDATSELENQLLGRMKAPLRYSLVSHAWSSVFSGVCGGIGIGILPTFMGDRTGTIEQLPCLPPASSPIWLVIHPDMKDNARTRALIHELEKLMR